jgi:pimeloyl-ACP methyl ester carboxylesterase
MTVSRRMINAGELSFEMFECGTGDRLALCLHGFPSHAICWRAQMSALVEKGYRVWAPNLRGYGRSSRPKGARHYTLDQLLDDIAQLIDASGAKSILLIGHDWGGLLAWFFAARQIRPLEGLVIMNAPHPGVARVAYQRWAQLRKAWYIAAFQVPWLPDLMLRAGRAWLVGRIFVWASGGRSVFTPEMLAYYRARASEPGAVTAMLNWYRALLRGGVPAEMKSQFPVIATPTLIVWGYEDVALDRSLLDGLDAYVSDLTIRRLVGVSHWVQEDEPETVSRLVQEFLDRLPASASS